MDPIAVVVDDRERAGGVLPELAASPHFDVTVRRLPVGDYCLNGRLIVERKTLPDLVESIKSGRLFKQALSLATQQDFQPVLVLEGSSRDLRGCDMRWEAIQGALVNVSLLIGLPVLRTRTAAETVQTFLCACAKLALSPAAGCSGAAGAPKVRRRCSGTFSRGCRASAPTGRRA